MFDKIREEHKKGLPSKRKILSYLLELLNKDKYPSLSDIEFYKIVGETYKLNLDYKLNLEILFYPIYNALKKKIKKLYGNEKCLEMEQYLIKYFDFKKKILNPRKSPDEKLDKMYDEILDEVPGRSRRIPDISRYWCVCDICGFLVLLIIACIIIVFLI